MTDLALRDRRAYAGGMPPDAPRPHPLLRWRRHDDGALEAWLQDWPDRIGRIELLRDGTWLVAVRPLQRQPEKAKIVASRDEAVALLVPWCRQRVWNARPNTHQGAPPGFGMPVGANGRDTAGVPTAPRLTREEKREERRLRG